jgi:hypothetical protein
MNTPTRVNPSFILQPEKRTLHLTATKIFHHDPVSQKAQMSEEFQTAALFVQVMDGCSQMDVSLPTNAGPR